MEELDWSKVNKKKYVTQMMGLSLSMRTMMYPLQTIKTRMQNQEKRTQYKNFGDAWRKIKRNEGYRGFYKGGFQIVVLVPASALYLCALEGAGSLLPPGTDTFYRGFLSGAAAGTASQFYFVPIDVITQKMQVDEKASSHWRDQMRNMQSISRQIWHTHGWTGFYKGFSLACLNHVPQSILFWSTYAPVKAKLRSKTPNELLEPIMAAAVASLTVNLCCSPFDTVKTRFQIRDDKSWVRLSQQLWHNEGILGFYKGFVVRQMIGFLSSVPMVCILEYMRRSYTY